MFALSIKKSRITHSEPTQYCESAQHTHTCSNKNRMAKIKLSQHVWQIYLRR